MTLTTDDVLAKFVYKTLPVIDGQPTYADINKMSKMLYANAAKVPTTLGGGKKGHIGLIMKASLYATISATAYDAPTEPTMPTNTGGTAAERELAIRQYKTNKNVFDNHVTVEETIKNMIVTAVHEAYLGELQDEYTEYLGVSTRDMLDHLLDRYGKITPSNVINNDEKMKQPMDVSQPISMYFKRINDCITYATDAETPYTPIQIVQITYHAMVQTGYFDRELDEWDSKVSTEKTWENFKLYFAEKYNKLMQRQDITAQAKGFQASNVMTEVSAALDHLATAATADRNAIEALIQSNKTLTATNKLFATQLSAIKTSLNQIRTDMKNMSGQPKSRIPLDPNGYCWSCGFKVGIRHNSRNCRFPKEGHQVEATRTNTMGGSRKNENWVPEA